MRKQWDIFMKTGEIGAYLDYRQSKAEYDNLYNDELWEDDLR